MRLLAICACGLSMIWLCGCSALNTRPPIEAMTEKVLTEAVIPAVREGLAQGVRQMTVQAGAQGINPTYRLEFAGKWVVGVEGYASVGVEGLSGQVQISTSGDDETRAGPR